MMQTPQWQGSLIGGRYKLVSLLGQGGMSKVYLAEDIKLKGKRWAIKECMGTDSSDTASFMEEAEMLAQLQHAQLPQLVDYFMAEDGNGFLVMDYIEGPTLQDLFEKNHRALPMAQIVQIVFQLLDIFHYLHTFQPRPIIYRDLKPSNVMVNEHNQVRLIDFGVARQYKQGQAADTMQMGTIGFAAPEQYLGLQTDERTDLYTLGSMLYYLLSGGNYAYLTQKPLDGIKTGIPEGLLTTIHDLLQDQPQNRCQSALEVKHRLRTIYPKHITSSPNSHSASSSLNILSDKLIVVGGLFAGVGATFTAITLARIFHALQIPNALVEQPTIEPDLYMLLFGDGHAPNAFLFHSEHIHNSNHTHGTPWCSGYTTWVPIPPSGFHGTWQTADSFKLLHMIKKPIVLWDVSTEWEHPTVQELCHSADHIIVMVDASPGKCARPSSRKIFHLIEAYQKRGKKVHIITRGAVPPHFQREWQEALPSATICLIPEIPRAEVMKAIWKGDAVQDQPDILQASYESLKPFLSEILPKMSLKPLGKPQRQGLFSKFKKLG